MSNDFTALEPPRGIRAAGKGEFDLREPMCERLRAK